jgi:hypothetical protein
MLRVNSTDSPERSMTTQARYVATTKDESQQTFIFDGTTTLDEVFTHVAQHTRGGSLATVLDKLRGTHKIFNLSVSRDESIEPPGHEEFSEQAETADA